MTYPASAVVSENEYDAPQNGEAEKRVKDYIFVWHNLDVPGFCGLRIAQVKAFLKFKHNRVTYPEVPSDEFFRSELQRYKDVLSSFSIPTTKGTFLNHLYALCGKSRIPQKCLDEGIFSLSAPLDRAFGGANSNQAQDPAFWTSPDPYWDVQTRAPRLYESLKTSDLVIFKSLRVISNGQRGPILPRLSVRLLTHISRSAWRDVDVGAGPLAGSFPLLSLRTNKANVVVGIDRQVAERLDQSGEKWRVSGRCMYSSVVNVILFILCVRDSA
ncbi:hypothetical protein F5887DRAFT_925409 [Amanita rubescens]|nr:hypothetical protein F5887DRAFT_925409 [Amanita rubescens]